jgi:hypothetical protein
MSIIFLNKKMKNKTYQAIQNQYKQIVFNIIIYVQANY